MSAAVATWRRFWFDPEPTSTLALVRIAFALVALGWTLSLAPDVEHFFGRSGITPDQPSVRWQLGFLGRFGSPAVVLATYQVLLVAIVCLLVGYRTRLASVVTFLGLLAFQRRNPYILNSGDVLVRLLAFYLVFAPAGAALSLDRRRQARAAGESFWAFPSRAPWALRMLQVQMSVLYLFTVWAKVRGTTWNDGTAVSLALRIEDLERFPIPDAVAQSLLAANLLTYGTLAVELALAVLVWNRRARPWVLAAGIALHLFIDLTITVGFFSYAILVTYVAFVPPETATARVLALRDALVARRERRTAATGAPVTTP